MLSGLPTSVAGTTINRFCSSGLQAITVAAHQIVNEGVDAAIGGGVESIFHADPGQQPPPRRSWKNYLASTWSWATPPRSLPGATKSSRQVQDEYSLLSQQRTARAQNENFFDGEIAPIEVTRGLVDKKTGEIASKEFATVSRDECNRPDTTLEGLLALKPYFDPDSGQGSVTAGNSSPAL